MLRRKLIPEYECFDCKKLFKTEEALTAHIWTHLKIRCLCCVCDKSFTSKQGAFKHRKDVHHYHGQWAPKWHCGICCLIVNDNQIHSHVRNCQRRNQNKLQFHEEFLEPEGHYNADTVNTDTKDGQQHIFACSLAEIVLVIGLALIALHFYFCL